MATDQSSSGPGTVRGYERKRGQSEVVDRSGSDDIDRTDVTFRGFLEIRLNGATVSRRRLSESHLVVGRVPGVQLLLDHHTVSRRHAEMFCDPFGRWWIRDLGSTNGTLINDEPITERVLTPADRIGIGDFQLTFHLEQASEQPKPQARAVEDDNPAAVRTLLDFDQPRISATQLRNLLEFSRRLLDIQDGRERLGELLRLMVTKELHGSMAVALRIQKDGSTKMLTRPFLQGGVTSDERAYISRRVIQTLRETREPVVGTNLTSTEDSSMGTVPSHTIASSDELTRSGMRSKARELLSKINVSEMPAVDLTISRRVMEMMVVACPLAPPRTDDQELDVLYVTLPPDFASVEWFSLIQLAAEVYVQGESAAMARKHAQAHAAIERELETARQIQRALLPKALDFPRLDLAVSFEPCKWVGGDYADIVPMADGRLLLAVADVCGKGLQAALVTSSLHTMVRATADTGRSLTELMERVNRHLCGWVPTHSFVTMVAIALSPSTGEIECVNAGHPPVLISSPRGLLRTLQSAANAPLGISPTAMDSERTVLHPGEVLAMYTDGLTELRNESKEMLGQERLGENFARFTAASSEVSSIAAAISKMVEDFRGTQLPEDDRAFILARRR